MIIGKFELNFSFYFHYINNTGLTFMALCDKNYSMDSAYVYLEDLKSCFIGQFSQREIESAIAYSLNTFKDKIKARMDYYNKNVSNDSISLLKKGVLDMKNDVLDASNILSQRGEKINLIVKKADLLRQESTSYYKSVNMFNL